MAVSPSLASSVAETGKSTTKSVYVTIIGHLLMVDERICKRQKRGPRSPPGWQLTSRDRPQFTCQFAASDAVCGAATLRAADVIAAGLTVGVRSLHR